MKRGEVWWVSFERATRGEIRKRRPAVIVSNDAGNKFLNHVQVVPLTSRADRLYPSKVYVWVGGKKGKTMADLPAPVSKERVFRRIGLLSVEDMRKVGDAIKTHLDLL